MSVLYPQDATGPMTYPGQGTFNRFLFKTPLILWRMGLGPMLGRSVLVLTTWGRKSRLPRSTMLSFVSHAGKLYIISGWGGRADWYRNLQANPYVTVQLGDQAFQAVARRVMDVDEYMAVERQEFEAGGDAFLRPWLASLGIAYNLDDLVAKRERVHLLALDPAGINHPALEPSPPALQADLKWVWGVMLASFAAGWLLGRISRRR